MILIESIIANSIKKKNCVNIKSRLEEHWLIMDDYEKEQAFNIYHLFMKKNICNELNWLNV